MGKDVIRNSRNSPKGGCPVDREVGFLFSGEDNDACLPQEDTEFQRKGYVMKSLQSP